MEPGLIFGFSIGIVYILGQHAYKQCWTRYFLKANKFDPSPLYGDLAAG